MRKTRPFLWLASTVLALLLGPAFPSGAQRELVGNTIRISVQVRDQAGNPLQGLSKVRLEKEDGGLIEESTTDADGRVQFINIPRESLVVVVHREGYLPARDRLGGRQSLREIFLSITLARSAALGEDAGGQLQAGTDYLSMPAKARREYDKGIAQARRGKYERAAAYLEKAARLYAHSPTLWNDLGSNYLRLQKYDLAETAFRKAIETDTSAAPPLLNLGMLYNLQRRFGEAEGLLVQFTKREGHRYQGFFELGNAHSGLGQFTKAENDYKRAMELNPQLPAEVHVKLANTYVARREFSKALKEFETYLQQNPNGGLAARVREVIQRMNADGVVRTAP